MMTDSAFIWVIQCKHNFWHPEAVKNRVWMCGPNKMVSFSLFDHRAKFGCPPLYIPMRAIYEDRIWQTQFPSCCTQNMELFTALYRYISVRQPSADNSSSLGSKLISSNAPTYDFYLRELSRSELTYLLTYSFLLVIHSNWAYLVLFPR